MGGVRRGPLLKLLELEGGTATKWHEVEERMGKGEAPQRFKTVMRRGAKPKYDEKSELQSARRRFGPADTAETCKK